MNWQRTTLRTAAAAAAVVLALAVAAAQPPAGKSEKNDAPRRPPKSSTAPKSEAPPNTATKADPAVEAWVKILGEKMTDRHDAVRDSARAALVTIGEPALPALRKLADSDDGATATAAKRVIEHIEHHRHEPPTFAGGPRPGTLPGPGGRPGAPPARGFGQGGFGGGGFGPGGFPGGAGGGGFNPAGGPGTRRGGGGGFGPGGFGGGAGGFGGGPGNPPGPGGFNPDMQRGGGRGAGGFGGGPGGTGGFQRGGANPPPAEKVEPPKPESPPNPPRGVGVGGAAGPGTFLNMMIRDLDLTDKQKDKAKELIAAAEKKLSDMTAKLREGAERPDREAMRAAFTKWREEIQKELRSILTDEQKKKFDERATRPGPGGPPKKDE